VAVVRKASTISEMRPKPSTIWLQRRMVSASCSGVMGMRCGADEKKRPRGERAENRNKPLSSTQ
jgi:hypothetical protein